MYTSAFAMVDVEVEDDATEDQIIDAALGESPTLCAQCTGWARHSGFSLELGEEWNIAEKPNPDGEGTIPDIEDKEDDGDE